MENIHKFLRWCQVSLAIVKHQIMYSAFCILTRAEATCKRYFSKQRQNEEHDETLQWWYIFLITPNITLELYFISDSIIYQIYHIPYFLRASHVLIHMWIIKILQNYLRTEKIQIIFTSKWINRNVFKLYSCLKNQPFIWWTLEAHILYSADFPATGFLQKRNLVL